MTNRVRSTFFGISSRYCRPSRDWWLCFLIICLFSAPSLAQDNPDNSLERVSAVERSDGQGYVVRYHMQQRPDSFRVHQPQADLVQMAIYSKSIDTTNVHLAEENDIYDEISFYKIPAGIGIDIYLSNTGSYKADSYRDLNSEDLLLGLTRTDIEEITALTSDVEPIIWNRLNPDAEDMIVSERLESDSIVRVDEDYNRAKDRMKFDTIIIDPGHGGHDPGSIGYRGVHEKDIVLAIAKKVGGYIEENMPDVEVVYTREDDQLAGADKNPNINAKESLFERGKIANQSEGDLFVSIHANKFHTPQPYGAEIFFLGFEEEGSSAVEVMKRENNPMGEADYDPDEVLSPEELLTYELQNSSYMATSEQIAGMMEHQFRNRAQRRSRGVKQGRFVVLYQASMPAILVETGFISNPSEQRFLTSDWGQVVIASAIFRAIRDYKEDYEKRQNYNTN